jgi:hypothetical protein
VTGDEADEDVRGEEGVQEQELEEEFPYDDDEGPYINPYNAFDDASPPPDHDFGAWDGIIPDFDYSDPHTLAPDWPDDEEPYINPYRSGLGPGSSYGDFYPTQDDLALPDEYFDLNLYDLMQLFDHHFSPERETPDFSDDEGPYMNPYDLVQSYDAQHLPSSEVGYAD